MRWLLALACVAAPAAALWVPPAQAASLPSAGEAAGAYDLHLISPCKINLFLRVTGRRPNGFHDLGSLFQCVSLHDDMYFSPLPSSAAADVFTCSDPRLPTDGSNLVLKALDLMRARTSRNAFFNVHLEKKIPFEAGLGGGSGNAATAMFAFNALTGGGASAEELQEWSGEIGSDISFFFSTGTAYCTGRGEVVQSLAPLPDDGIANLHIFKPDTGLSTAAVFKALDLEQRSTEDPLSLLNRFTQWGPLDAAAMGATVNDLEAPAMSLMPRLRELKDALLAAGFQGVMMSGSGTSVFALAGPKVANRRVAEAAAAAGLPLEAAGVNAGGGVGMEEVAAVQRVMQDFPEVQHFTATFLNRRRSPASWYDVRSSSVGASLGGGAAGSGGGGAVGLRGRNAIKTIDL